MTMKMNSCNYEKFVEFLREKGKSNPWEHVVDLCIKSGHYYDVSQQYVCEEDKSIIEKYNESVNKKGKKECEFVLDNLSLPFEGDVFNSKIIVLTLNPGFVEEVNHTLYTLLNEDSQKKITDYHIQNLQLQCKGIVPNDAVNFIGDRYWLNKTKKIRHEYGFGKPYIAIVQYIGYQSREFYDSKELRKLKSIEFATLLIEFIIKYRTDDYCFIIARRRDVWNNVLLSHLTDDIYKLRVTELKSNLNTTISKGNIKDWTIIERILENKKNTMPNSLHL